MLFSPLYSKDINITATIEVNPDTKDLLKLMLFGLTWKYFFSSPTGVEADTDKPMIEPPSTQPQIEIPKLSIETNDWAWKAIHDEKIPASISLLFSVRFLRPKIARFKI